MYKQNTHDEHNVGHMKNEEKKIVDVNVPEMLGSNLNFLEYSITSD